MWSNATASGLTVRAPAKVNLFLEVLGKRPDGYHDLATLMVAIDLCDTLDFQLDSAPGFRLEVSMPADGSSAAGRPPLSAGPDNLVCRAAELLQRHTGHPGGARGTLRKQIPLQAGLAGGSSDAAAALVGLNRLWQLGLTETELARLGAELGSDVPFFFFPPAAWCTGRGEIVTPLRPPETPLWFVLACPAFGIATAAVFRALTPPSQPESGEALRRAFEQGEVEALGQRLHNRLQPVAEQLCPEVGEVDRLLGSQGAAGHLMSGSGSTLFALCRTQGDAQHIATRLTQTARASLVSRVYVVRSCW